MRVVINRRPYEVPERATILDALRLADVRLPALCHDDRLAPIGVCRLCLVEVKGAARPLAACTTAVSDGMEIESDTPDLEETRRSILEMLARRYPPAAVERFPDEPFHTEIRDRRIVAGTGFAPANEPAEDGSHPYITVDMSRCIDCYRCVRICADVQGQFVWHVRGRGTGTRIEPDGPTLRDSSCVSCGACVDTCPTGALDDRQAGDPLVPADWTRTICPYCGVGCEIDVGTRDGRIVSVRPVLDAPVNRGHLCVKGRYAHGFVSAPDRIAAPMIRDAAGWRPVSWSEATMFVAHRIADLVARHGPDSIGILGSARATNEDNYVAQKFARAVVGTNNVDCCARVCHAPSAAALKRTLGAGLSTNSFDDIEMARAILVCGANATESHPVVGARIKQAARRGAHLIVVDPRRIELAHYAEVHLAIEPGTNVPLFNAMAHVIVTEGLYDRRFVDRRVSGFEDFARFIEQWPPDRAARLCGVDADEIRRAARLYATNVPALSVHGLGLTEHAQGTDNVVALIDLALLTGNVGRPGSGVNPLRGQNNVQGAAHMGCDPRMLPGSTPIDLGRERCERQWGVPLPVTPGLHMLEMMDAAIEGRLKGLWTIGYDVLMTNPNTAETTRALRSLDLVIVQDMFLNETAREFGSVFLPACSSFEKDGTFMNAERRIQRVRAALSPIGASRPDWEIVCDVARAMGASGFDFAAPSGIWDEVRALCDGGVGMPYARLDNGGLQWPCPSTDHPGTSILHRDAFPSGPRAMLQRVEYRGAARLPAVEYPLRLITGRTLYQFNAGTMTRRSPNVVLHPTDVLDISPDDAARMQIADGDLVRVVSPYGTAVLPAHHSAAVQPGQLFATFHDPSVRLNAVTGPERDASTGTPQYKLTMVRVERIPPGAAAARA